VHILGQAPALVELDTKGGEQHGVLAHLGYALLLALLQVPDQAVGLVVGLGRVHRGIPAADEQLLQRLGQGLQLGLGQPPTEGGLAGTGVARQVERLLSEPLQQQ
jgi:hypothetical protein